MILTRTPYNRAGFTLTELLVAVALIVVLVGVSVPAFSVWESRKLQDSINLVDNVLQVAQTTAVTRNQTIGLFFYIDPESKEQVIWSIEPSLEPNDIAHASGNGHQFSALSANRYILREKAPFKLPKPYRIAPRDVIREDILSDTHLYWTNPLLGDSDSLIKFGCSGVEAPSCPQPGVGPNGEDGTQFDRNHFVMLFDADGLLQSGYAKRIYIVDPEVPDDTTTGQHSGAKTKLVTEGQTEPWHDEAIVDDAQIRIEFIPADGVLLYNDDEFQNQDPTKYKEWMLQNAQPLYVHPSTGRVIKPKLGADLS